MEKGSGWKILTFVWTLNSIKMTGWALNNVRRDIGRRARKCVDGVGNCARGRRHYV
jgi:hypothetical protein